MQLLKKKKVILVLPHPPKKNQIAYKTADKGCFSSDDLCRYGTIPPDPDFKLKRPVLNHSPRLGK